jgi:gentisate 1,2-dioxygenase
MTAAATRRTGDGQSRWFGSAYVRPLVAAMPPSEPELGVLPHRWRSRDLRRLSTGDPAGGRSLALVNPGLAGETRTTRTLTCAVTHLRPGVQPATGPPSAGVRVVLEGGARFTASGTVSRGDVVRLQDVPPEAWRAGDGGVLWLDVLDLPLVAAISPDSLDPARVPAPRRGGPCPPTCRPLARVQRWARTEAVLAEGRSDDGFPTVARFGRPKVAGDLTATLRAEAHRLQPGHRSPSVRSSQSAVVVVLAGTGTSVVGGWRFAWEPGDVFVAPPGAPVDHQADVAADLIVISDAPALGALGLWWAQTDPDHQPVEHTLD